MDDGPALPSAPAREERPVGPSAALVRAAWWNLDRLGRLRAAVRAPCAACGLGADGLRDPVFRGLHFCGRRADTLRAGLRETVPPEALASADVLRSLPDATLAQLGRMSSAWRGSGAGYVRVRWDEVADAIAPARNPWFVVGPGLPLEVRLAARACFGSGAIEAPEPPAARVLRERCGTALAPIPLSALRRAEWVLLWSETGRDPSDRWPMLSPWLSGAAGPVVAVGAPVRGGTEGIACPPERTAALATAVASGVAGAPEWPPGLPEAEIDHLVRRLRGGPVVMLVDGHSAALADAVLSLAGAWPTGPAHGFHWLWDPVPLAFEAPGTPEPEPDLVVVHGHPSLHGAVGEAIRRAPRRLHLVDHLDAAAVARGADVCWLPARPAWEQDGVSFLALDRRVRCADPDEREPLGESRSDFELLRIVAAALGRPDPMSDPAAVRRAWAARDPRYRGWETLERSGDHVFLGGPYLPVPR